MAISRHQDNVHAFFNAQPHIDNVKAGLTYSDRYQSDKYTFILKHKHFDLSPGEVLFVEEVADGYDITVKKREQLDIDVRPCMWLFASRWIPFAYTEKRLGLCDVTDMPPAVCNLGVRWLNNGGIEETNESERLQYVRRANSDENAITTFINVECESGCETRCLKTNCINSPGQHKFSHMNNHTGKPR